MVQLHDEGKRGSSLATAIMEHAGSLVSLAGAYYCSQRYVDAADAYSKSLAVFEMIDDTDKVAKCLINLANLYELQVRGRAGVLPAVEYSGVMLVRSVRCLILMTASIGCVLALHQANLRAGCRRSSAAAALAREHVCREG